MAKKNSFLPMMTRSSLLKISTLDSWKKWTLRTKRRNGMTRVDRPRCCRSLGTLGCRPRRRVGINPPRASRLMSGRSAHAEARTRTSWASQSRSSPRRSAQMGGSERSARQLTATLMTTSSCGNISPVLAWTTSTLFVRRRLSLTCTLGTARSATDAWNGASGIVGAAISASTESQFHARRATLSTIESEWRQTSEGTPNLVSSSCSRFLLLPLSVIDGGTERFSTHLASLISSFAFFHSRPKYWDSL